MPPQSHGLPQRTCICKTEETEKRVFEDFISYGFSGRNVSSTRTSDVQQPSRRKEVPAHADICPLDWTAVDTKQA